MLFQALLLIFFSSCQTAKLSQWHLQKDHGSHQAFNFIRIYYPPKDVNSGLELEFASNSSGFSSYINVFSEKIPMYQNDPEKALLTIKTEKKELNFIVHRLKGEQRLLLTKKQTTFLEESLKGEREIHLFLDGYEESISSKGFLPLLKRLKKSISKNLS